MQNLSLQHQKNLVIRHRNIHVVHVRCVQHEKELYLTSYEQQQNNFHQKQMQKLSQQHYKNRATSIRRGPHLTIQTTVVATLSKNSTQTAEKHQFQESSILSNIIFNKQQQKNIPRTLMQNLSLPHQKNIAVRHRYIHAVHVRCVQNKKNYILCRQNLSVYWMSAIVILFPLSSASTTTSGSSASTTASASSSGSRQHAP